VSESRRWACWIGFELAATALAIVVLALGLGGLRVSRAEVKQEAVDAARQVTVIGIIATPGSSSIDSRLATIKSQLEKLRPKHGFKLLDAQSKRLETGESVGCDLKDGYASETVLVRPLDDGGKVELRCELRRGDSRLFSTLVKTPLNQLFFYERELEDGSELLIGVGARYTP
jgi:hypothetical protein